MKSIYDVSAPWRALRNDVQMLGNAACIQARFPDNGLQPAIGGERF
jgi:hypothetical protein